MDKIFSHELAEWKKLPVSEVFFQVVKEHLQADREALAEIILNTRGMTPEVINQLTVLKGQIYAFNAQLETKEFLLDYIKKSEINNETKIHDTV